MIVEHRCDQPPTGIHAKALLCEDGLDAEDLVAVYAELSDFMRSLLEPWAPGAFEPAGDLADQLPDHLRSVAMRIKLVDLRLAYWTDRLGASPHRACFGGGHGDSRRAPWGPRWAVKVQPE